MDLKAFIVVMYCDDSLASGKPKATKSGGKGPQGLDLAVVRHRVSKEELLSHVYRSLSLCGAYLQEGEGRRG